MGKRSRAKERAGQSVKERRAAAKSSGMSMKQYKSGAKAPSSSKSSGTKGSSSNKGGGGGSSTPNFTNAQMAGKGSGGGLVKARRDAQQASGLSMKDYRAGVSGGTLTKHGKAISGSGGLQNAQNAAASGGSLGSSANQYVQKYGSGLKGYANWWNAEGLQKAKDSNAAWKAREDAKGHDGSSLAGKEFHFFNVTDKGLFDWDSTKPMESLDVGMMKQFGIKGGDKIFDPNSFKSVNAHHGATSDGTLDAHYYAGGLAMALDTSDQGRMTKHQEQMTRNKYLANASGTKFSDSSGLYQDKYNVGYHGKDDKGSDFVGSDHYESINKSINEYGRGLKAGIDDYIRDGGYAGDALKIIDSKHKQNLTSEADIKWYNSLVKQAQNFDWEAENQSRAGDAGGYYDVRAGGMSQSSINANKQFEENRNSMTQGGFTNDYDQGRSNQYQQNQFQQQNNMNYDFSQFMPSQRQGQKFQSFQGYSGPTSFGAGMKFSFDPSKFMQGQ